MKLLSNIKQKVLHSDNRFLTNAVSFIRSRPLLSGAAVLILVIAVSGGGWLVLHEGGHDHGILHYTCPMHPQVKDHKPGKCPICHMDLVPVYKPGYGPDSGKSDSGNQAAAADSGMEPGAIHIVNSRIQLLGVKKFTVKKGILEKELHTTGRVAFDPELAVAVREYLQVAGRDPSLRKAAESRLRLLGMGQEEIYGILRAPGSYESLYLPGGGDKVWVYATVYDQDLPYIKPGMTVRIQAVSLPGRKITGIVKSLSPVVDPLTRSVTARIQTDYNERGLRPDSYVDVFFTVKSGEGLILPRSAVISTGRFSAVFRLDQGGVFTPVEVHVMAESAAEALIAEFPQTDKKAVIREGDTIAATGAFLLDSESRLMNPGFFDSTEVKEALKNGHENH